MIVEMENMKLLNNVMMATLFQVMDVLQHVQSKQDGIVLDSPAFVQTVEIFVLKAMKLVMKELLSVEDVFLVKVNQDGVAQLPTMLEGCVLQFVEMDCYEVCICDLIDLILKIRK
jgi:hypothetical protein